MTEALNIDNLEKWLSDIDKPKRVEGGDKSDDNIIQKLSKWIRTPTTGAIKRNIREELPDIIKKNIIPKLEEMETLSKLNIRKTADDSAEESTQKLFDSWQFQSSLDNLILARFASLKDSLPAELGKLINSSSTIRQLQSEVQNSRSQVEEIGNLQNQIQTLTQQVEAKNQDLIDLTEDLYELRKQVNATPAVVQTPVNIEAITQKIRQDLMSEFRALLNNSSQTTTSQGKFARRNSEFEFSTMANQKDESNDKKIQLASVGEIFTVDSFVNSNDWISKSQVNNILQDLIITGKIIRTATQNQYKIIK